jgi:hypothetical protein
MALEGFRKYKQGQALITRIEGE